MNNAEAVGYMVIAAKRFIGLDKDLIRELESAMLQAMDTYTEHEAEIEYLRHD